VPQNNDNTYCPANGTSCYFYRSTTSTYSSAGAFCQNLGGYVVAWNSDPEQLDVERYFISTASLARYWIGMFKAGTLYFWNDGGFIGGLVPKRASPYVHVSGAVLATARAQCCALLLAPTARHLHGNC
jgi:hypothetical protein